MSYKFDDKVAVVTGGNSGIGKATAAAFADAGAKVVITARREEEGEQVAAALREKGGDVQFVRADVSNSDDVKNMVQFCVDTYGGLDFGFNNAGIEGTPFIPVADHEESAWREVIDINLTGIFLAMKYQVPEILKRGGGAIVNMSSVAGLTGSPGGVAYVASKHGIIGLTKAAALDYATQNIRINVVCPGLIKTEMLERGLTDPELRAQVQPMIDMHPIGRIGELKEVADAVLWLCSEQSSFITGQALPIDGGYTTV
ncbi:MAG: glucose 1-dehydrogenase [Pseudomonadota bacterium]